ncbi:hypothetical protein DD238_006687 [Peronospora effusa]|uniref:Protein kinase domain-containing protein n=1 Tax=Peronospora effusa TaxID=542832 RepID=A0A3M6VD97_9STRA|nr:hypothetical protein DD238_006687 [Peronospora effusa]RQM16890.1 hypothetical protein DD237_004874 [Peronospora effusa]
MVDRVTIGASVAMRSVREPGEGIYEYLEEQYPLYASSEQVMALPIRLKGWLWRREGLGIFRRYRRRFCVFKAQQATLDVYSDDEKEHRKLLQHLILTRVTLTSRLDRLILVQGYRADQNQNQMSESMTRRAIESWRGLFGEDIQKCCNRQEEENFKAVSAKACSVWTHCFKYHMKSYGLRKQKMMQKGKHEENVQTLTGDEKNTEKKMEMDPNFVFEDTSKCKRRHSVPVSSFRDSIGSGLFSNTSSKSRRREEAMVRRPERVKCSVSEASKSASSPVQVDQTIVTSNPMVVEDMAMKVAAEILQTSKEKVVDKKPSHLISDFPSIWDDEELLSHRIDFNAIVKKEMLATGACGEVWRAIHRSQDVVVKNLLQQVTTGTSSPPSIKWSDGRRRAILGFIEEIRIMSRLEHGRIVEFRGVALSSERNLLFVMEYLPRGDLKTFLGTVRRKGNTSSRSNSGFQSIWTWTKYQWRLAIDIIEGLVYLHSLNPPLVHGDLKSANILLRSDLRAKLTDFGLSHYLLSDEDKDTELAGKHENNASSSRYGSRAYGTGRWMAPELIKGGAQSSIASDVYAFGIVLSEIDTCALPFHEREKSAVSTLSECSSDDSDFRSINENAFVRKIVADGWKPSLRVTCPEVIKKLAHDCLLPDPSKRPTSLVVAYRLRQAALKRDRPESLAAQAKAITSLYIY